MSNDESKGKSVHSEIAAVKGVVAVLDALGVSLLSIAGAREFIDSRDDILDFAQKLAEAENLPGLDTTRLQTFTLNDTVVYAYESKADVSLSEVEGFCHLLRVLEVLAITERIPWRGALAVGEYFVGDKQTILGPAVSDAAAWYEEADWIGIHATPHATMFIQALLEETPRAQLEHVLLDYEVPLKDKPRRLLKAVNWPKGFYMSGLRPDGAGTTRGLVLKALTKRRVPKGTESKYFHAVSFFDHVEEVQDLEKKFRTGEMAGRLKLPRVGLE